jgi:DNA polymerase III delta subunit
MITVLTGENSFEIKRALDQLTGEFNGTPEYIDGDQLQLRQLPDILTGSTLLTDMRLIIIKNLVDNKTIWNKLDDWLEHIPTHIQLVLVEPKPDKRTKTYKTLQKLAKVHEFKVWNDRDRLNAEKWVRIEATSLKIKLSPTLARSLISHVGLDQWALHNALQKLALVDELTLPVMEDVIEAHPTENIFNLFEKALKGDIERVKIMISTLELTDDPYQAFGLLSGQVFQLAALAVSDKPSAIVANDLAVHPFALSKLSPYAKKLNKSKAKKIIDIFVEADDNLKTSSIEPWLLIERALMKITQVD